MSELEDILRRAGEKAALLQGAYLLSAEPATPRVWRWAAALAGGLLSLLLPIGSAALCL